MQDRPTASELLATVADYLERELLPSLDGPSAYRTRVAANLVKILERETTHGPALLARECELLSDLLRVGYVSDPLELNRRLARAIDAGEVSHADAWTVLMEIARAKIAVIRPGYDDYDASGELP
jgi:Domain of unknown function (DUF6285)